MNTMKSGFFVVIALCLSGLARADFSIIPDGAPAGGNPESSTQDARYGVRGVGIPLSAALKKLAPEGWQGYADKGKVNPNFIVEIDPGVDWYDSLSKMANRYNLHIKADPNKKTIHVSEGPGGIRDLETEKKKLESAVLASERKSTAPESREGNTDFVVRDGQKLSEALEQFLKKGDWRMEWEAGSDYTVKKGYSVTGNSLRDVLDAALTSYGIHAILYTINRVVVVRSNSVMSN